MNNMDFDFLGPAFSAERWAYAGRMTLLGMVAVFAVLALLWLLLVVFEKLMNGKKAAKEPAAEPIKAASSAPVSEPVKSGDDEALIALITAAIEAYRASECGADYSGAFRVVSFKRVSGKGAWNAGK